MIDKLLPRKTTEKNYTTLTSQLIKFIRKYNDQLSSKILRQADETDKFSVWNKSIKWTQEELEQFLRTITREETELVI